MRESILKKVLGGAIERDTLDINMIFYRDGMFLFNFYDINVPRSGATQNYLEDVYHGIGLEMFYKSFFWGIYTVDHDTVTAQVIFNRGKSVLAPWDAREYKFAIRNANALELLKTTIRSLDNPTKAEEKALRQSWERRQFSLARFVPYPFIPPSDSWLKKEDWIWCRD